ncbi:hypothetical protein NQ315_017451 [Exocentrus adspersus]|uniref:DUF5641 domain-containing protein n=1 Tax=Exocentrus adspersus TaxID=1586481 RepID=A0AAV8VL35_9CUCU|nr:hypothetical protein NQ315_017451 [Exocentrus adspersus]
MSNDPRILNQIQNSQPNAIFNVGKSEETHSLGLIWNSGPDTLKYEINIKPPSGNATKRKILSTVAQIYDPLGLLGPVILKAKIILQKLWALKISWDESLPSDIFSEWQALHQNLPMLNKVSVTRRVLTGTPSCVELHGFADASERGYGACIYIRCVNDSDNIFVNLLCAKSRVALLKMPSEDIELRKQVTVSNHLILNKFELFNSYSDFSKLRRVIAYVLRFKFNSSTKNNKLSGPLSTHELNNSLMLLIKLAQLIYEHKRLLHAGPQLLLSSLRQKYWIIAGRNLARTVVHKCIICFRSKPPDNTQYIMADLPPHRVTPSRPFLEENLPPLKWSLGKVLELHPGADGEVRVVTVRGPSGVLKRPVKKLCVIPVET